MNQKNESKGILALKEELEEIIKSNKEWNTHGSFEKEYVNGQIIAYQFVIIRLEELLK